MERDDGGPAFPTSPVLTAAGEAWRDGIPQEFAAVAYTFADAMLKARKEGGT